MAFIRERNGKFSVVYKIKDDKGKVHQKSETFRKKKEAEKRKHEIEYQMDTGTFKVEKCTTIEELLAEYVKLYGREKWAVLYNSSMIKHKKISSVSFSKMEVNIVIFITTVNLFPDT